MEVAVGRSVLGGAGLATDVVLAAEVAGQLVSLVGISGEEVV